MKQKQLAFGYIVSALAAVAAFPAVCQAVSEEEIFEKIRMLEMQIQELREMKAQQNKTERKKLDCMKAVGMEKFCSCLAEKLPGEVGFEQYVHIIVAPPVAAGDVSRKMDQGVVDGVHAVRDTCIPRGEVP